LALFSTPALVSQELLYVVVNNIAAHLLPAPPKTAIDWHAGIILQLIFLKSFFTIVSMLLLTTSYCFEYEALET
tara:strand:- start:88 stop:309 length:222 start_codon:yes stop_codon:yes gene_type:complete